LLGPSATAAVYAGVQHDEEAYVVTLHVAPKAEAEYEAGVEDVAVATSKLGSPVLAAHVCADDTPQRAKATSKRMVAVGCRGRGWGVTCRQNTRHSSSWRLPTSSLPHYEKGSVQQYMHAETPSTG